MIKGKDSPNQVLANVSESLVVMVDPVLIKRYFDHVIGAMQDIFELSPKSIFVNKAPFARLFDFAKAQAASALAEAKSRIEQNANTLIASMPIFLSNQASPLPQRPLNSM